MASEHVQQQLERAVELLQLNGWKVVAPRPEPEPRTCMYCLETEDAYRVTWMTDLRVVIARGEEGHGEFDGFVCELCLEDVQTGLAALGVRTHGHRRIDFLEDTQCPGARDPEECPRYTDLEDD